MPYSKEKYERNKATIIKRISAWKKKNPAKVKSYMKKCKEAKPEQYKAYARKKAREYYWKKKGMPVPEEQ